MKKIYKLLLIFVAIASISTLSVYYINKKASSYIDDYNTKRTAILNNYNKSLTELNSVIDTAKGYLDIYTISSEERYNDVKAVLYDKLNEDMKLEFDLLKGQLPLKSSNITYTVNDVYSSMEYEGDATRIRIHFELKEGNSVKNHVVFVTVKDSLITSADSFIRWDTRNAEDLSE